LHALCIFQGDLRRTRNKNNIKEKAPAEARGGERKCIAG
jgi:hypothetical protein